MPKLYRRNCNVCGKFYAGVGEFYCGNQCAHKSLVWKKNHSRSLKGRVVWNKGKILTPMAHCLNCGAEFVAYKRSKNRKRFCSIRCSKTGRFSPMWVGERIGYGGIHAWVKRRLKKPTKCGMCNNGVPLDLANISQKYQRKLSDWEWICRRCHMTKDGRLEKAKRTQFKKGDKVRLGAKLSPAVKGIISQKLKFLWQNPEYRNHMVWAHKKVELE